MYASLSKDRTSTLAEEESSGKQLLLIIQIIINKTEEKDKVKLSRYDLKMLSKNYERLKNLQVV